MRPGPFNRAETGGLVTVGDLLTRGGVDKRGESAGAGATRAVASSPDRSSAIGDNASDSPPLRAAFPQDGQLVIRGNAPLLLIARAACRMDMAVIVHH